MVSQVIELDSLEDPRLDAYRDIRHRNPTRYSGQFIVESKLLVDRLVASAFGVESILVDRRIGQVPPAWLERDVPIYCIDDASELIGFHFHRGALACGQRPHLPAADTIVTNATDEFSGAMLYQVQDPENMGSIFRTCAALGVNEVIIGPNCVDPFARRVIRVSMGTVFKLHLSLAEHSHEMLRSAAGHGISSYATSLSARSIDLASLRPAARWLLIFGNEAQGLPADICDLATKSVKIHMENSVDSLNVSHAAAIFLYTMKMRAQQNSFAIESGTESS